MPEPRRPGLLRRSSHSIRLRSSSRSSRLCVFALKDEVVNDGCVNQVIRPFTAKWHKLSLAGAFDDENECKRFRAELQELQAVLRKYAKMLSNMAGVEDLTALESG